MNTAEEEVCVLTAYRIMTAEQKAAFVQSMKDMIAGVDIETAISPFGRALGLSDERIQAVLATGGGI